MGGVNLPIAGGGYFRLLPYAWTYVEWDLSNAAHWNSWVGGNGTINAANVTVDAIWLERAHTTYSVNVHIDEVQWRPN